MRNCTHSAPVPFGSMDVTWSPDGLTGRIVIECRECGEYLAWEVE